MPCSAPNFRSWRQSTSCISPATRTSVAYRPLRRRARRRWPVDLLPIMKFRHPQADVYVPAAGADPREALRRVTHLCVGAHQDDIEIMAHAGICDCLDQPGKAFGGVVV